MHIKRIFLAMLTAIAIFFCAGCSEADINALLDSASPMPTQIQDTAQNTNKQVSKPTNKPTSKATSKPKQTKETLDKNGEYTSKEDVALYLHLYQKLPKNYITKKEAEKDGWDSHEGNLDEIAPGKSIGGDRFGNYEKSLPTKSGRSYRECDINYTGGYRDAERIIYSNDGLIYYTNDHYNTFEKLYGEE